MVQRVVYRRRCGYNTRSNRVKIIKTPGTSAHPSLGLDSQPCRWKLEILACEKDCFFSEMW
jgi:Ribosomal protein L34e